MYIDKIDELVDKIIDDFYNRIFLDKKAMKMFEEINFIKYQLDINNLLNGYFETIDKEDIIKILQDEINTQKMIDFIKKYIMYYTFATFAFYYKGKQDTFINNIIEFSKNQPKFNFKIENFFNSESNATTISMYILIKHVLEFMNASTVKINQMSKNPNYNDAKDFLDKLGPELVESLKLKNFNGKIGEQAHNIIKTIIILELYIKTDKKDVYKFLEKEETTAGEFIYIDIVMPRVEFIDYQAIELSLSQKDVERGLATEIYNLLVEHEESGRMKDLTHDEKILALIDSKLLIPITEDFLLYHKETEKYEGQASTKSTMVKRKEDTKIKYIINKIDNATELFSKNTKEKSDIKNDTEKIFYPPLADRRAILVNAIEDIKIITKLENQGLKAIENNEYYHDLINYKRYPYINFKDFQKNGLSLLPDKTIDAIRSINFEKVNIHNKNKNIQFRVGSEGLPVNIIGFIIASRSSDIKCFKLKDFIDVRKVGITESDKNVKKIENGYTTTLKILDKTLLSKKNKKRPPIYWMLDLDKDKIKMENYDVSGKMDVNEQSKIVITSLYDQIITILNDKIIKYIKNDSITLQKFYKIINQINNKILTISDDESYNDLRKIIFDQKTIRLEDQYDIKEDEFPGLFGKVIELPSVKPKESKQFHVIKLEKTIEYKGIEIEEMEAEKYGAICQHNITWDNMMAIRKKNPNRFSEMLFEFYQQYVEKNYENDYICKSCGTQINLKDYVVDGSYDGDGRFVSFSIPMEIPLEDIPEYEKYKKSIENLGKYVDRIANIGNINTLHGTSATIKGRIKRVVKDAIDLILIHNTNLKPIYNERRETLVKYGINKNLSNFFIFELDNNIFVYSTKDKDKFKPIKRNNIVTYLLFLIIIELSDTQIYYMTGDKICNYFVFEKYGIAWFNDIKIRKNNGDDLVPILNYKVLCYIIFYMSCLLTKNNMWHYESTDKKKKFDPNIQKTIIHTLIDFINSVLEIYGQKKKNFIYDIVANKFFHKLNSTFMNDDILKKLKSYEDKKRAIVEKKTKKTSEDDQSIIVAGEYTRGDYSEIPEWMTIKIAKSFIPRRIDEFEHYHDLSDLTNDTNGKFHKFIIDGKNLKCELCSKILLELKDTNKDDIKEKYIEQQQINLAKKYCLSGELHNFIYEHESKCNICTKCHFKELQNISTKDLNELSKLINNMKNEQNNVLEKERRIYQSKEEKRLDKNKKIINEMKSAYGESKRHKEDFYKFIDNFIKKIESIIGKDINLNASDIFLRHDSYIIDHDHNGNMLDKPFTIIDDGNKMSYKSNHPFFKRDVVSYVNYKLQIEVFYNAETKLLLGYKEKNKETQYAKTRNIYLKTNYSILNILKMFGYNSKFIHLKSEIDKNMEIYKDKNMSLTQYVSDLSRSRINILKKIISDIQRYVHRVGYNFDIKEGIKTIGDETDPDAFLLKYKNKLTGIVTNDKEKKIKFMKNWKVVKTDLTHEKLGNKPININPDDKYVLFENVSDYDYSGNIILFYIIQELGKLIDMNTDKFVKTSLTYLLLDIIVRLHNEYNEEKHYTNKEIKRFIYSIDIADPYQHIHEEMEELHEELAEGKDLEAELEGKTEEAEQKYDDMEENDAIDVDQDGMDYEVDYADGVNMN